ncbi:signal peptide peptidase SppA [Echinimonas agarilytica]|uniref:Signal peptide peptidase SppA n=1 Tax=Echinimonas agarilytica TaxID=1215918 RepID=A0AA41W9C7_9GAMM|nr:signal peptide peptidase SppA [Echinimonas agarilytica]MCM2680803.1 signal peptide peptidase SppA [Echinimonas agarilytica]
MKTLGRMVRGLWHVLNTTRKVVLNLIFIVILISIIAAMSNQEGEPSIEEGALMLSINGRVVEQLRPSDPFSEVMTQMLGGQEEDPEVLLYDIIHVIDNAKHDKRVKALVIDVSSMMSSGLSKMREIGSAIESFKEANKPVIAIGDWYSQDQYYLATHADTIMMNPNGMLVLEGYASYPLYFKSMLEKLKVSTHVFRVGTYKSAVEPFIRDDMSPAAKEANQQFLGDLWEIYLTDIAKQRGLDKQELRHNIINITELMKEQNGNIAAVALETGLIDELADRQTVRTVLTDLVGYDEEHHTFKQINFDQYLAVSKQNNNIDEDQDLVGIVVAKGQIRNGNQPTGQIGGDSTARLLRQARNNDQIKAVVLRIDSPGGSAFASDIIRAEIDELRKAGKPVIASMSSIAASGGYWIAAPTDKIYASPATITGSIGIFGMITTFENSLDYIGVHADGVGTTPLAGVGVTRALPPTFENLIQQNIEHGYRKFLSLVADHREMTFEEVDNVAQGRVWSGLRAKELGLVDEFGDLNAAISDAAELAGLSDYDTQVVEKPLTEREKFIQALFSASASVIPETVSTSNHSMVRNLLGQVEQRFEFVTRVSDPMHAYALCLQCEL